MRLTILGGGGFRTPLVVQAVAQAGPRLGVDEIVLHDVDAQRVAVIQAVLQPRLADLSTPVRVRVESDLTLAIAGADFVFSAIRVGGTAGRVNDEAVARSVGVLGQETVGPGGLAYAMRTVPVVDAIASAIATLAPSAWVVNFTNPAGLVTEAMRTHLDRVIGICDTPIGLLRSAARAARLPEQETFGDYLGLNHLGWLRSLEHGGRDYLPDLLADRDALRRLDEAALFDIDWLQALGMIPGEYLHYYDAGPSGPGSRGADAPSARAEFLHSQQERFYAAGTDGALARWGEVLAEREHSYMAEARTAPTQVQRLGGGYHEVAVDLMAALVGGEPARMILNLPNQGAIAELPADAVIEVSARIDGTGAQPWRQPAPLTGPQRGLVMSVKACEQLAISAARTGSWAMAWQAFSEHPLVRSPERGRALLTAYLESDSGLAQILTPQSQ
ncbi:MAG: 6-phospho-beta-glucosidase [Beutenbergiaceae bacterium]